MMRAVDRTTKLFSASLEATGLCLKISIDKSRTRYGRSNYVFIRHADACRFWKVRISDHPIGMNRALSGREDLYIMAGTKPASWAVWVGDLVRKFLEQKVSA